MRAHFGLPSVVSEETEGKPPIQVKFEIPYFTTSGIQVLYLRTTVLSLTPSRSNRQELFNRYLFFLNQVRYLKIIEKSGYQALPWVRYITQNGDYQLRTN